jgi:DNA polymerase III delta prime subunit
MDITLDLIDKVVLHKGRVWTIYSSSNDGVFAYQGLKPFSTFNYNEDSRKYSSFKKNIAFIKQDEINILTDEEIKAAVKKEERDMKKPLSRKKAIDFFVYLTGHTKAFVSKNIQEDETIYQYDTIYDKIKSDKQIRVKEEKV